MFSIDKESIETIMPEDEMDFDISELPIDQKVLGMGELARMHSKKQLCYLNKDKNGHLIKEKCNSHGTMFYPREIEISVINGTPKQLKDKLLHICALFKVTYILWRAEPRVEFVYTNNKANTMCPITSCIAAFVTE